MNTRTDNTQNTTEEFRQAAKRLGDGVAYVAREVPWTALVKGTFKLAINILRYSMGIAIYGLIIWPYRLLVAPGCAVAAGVAGAAPAVLDDAGDSQEDAYTGPYYDAITGEESFVPVPGHMTFDGRTVGYDGKLY